MRVHLTCPEHRVLRLQFPSAVSLWKEAVIAGVNWKSWGPPVAHCLAVRGGYVLNVWLTFWQTEEV